MSDRQRILARVREALREPTDAHVRHMGPTNAIPEPGGGGDGGGGGGGAGEVPDIHSGSFRGWLPQVGETHEARRDLFAWWSQQLRTEFHAVPDRDAAMAKLVELRDAHGWVKPASHHTPLNDAVCDVLGLGTLWTDAGYDKRDLAACDVGVTGCEALIAQTGSVLITSLSSGGRALSVLPPHHVVIATKDQLLPDLVAGYQHLARTYGEHYPSLISFITGPSRTGDIERILVLGAHGPRRLSVILIES